MFYNPESSVEVSVYPDLLNKSGEWVKVSWDLDSPSTEDWVGFFLLPNDSSMIDPKHHAPTKFQVAMVQYLGLLARQMTNSSYHLFHCHLLCFIILGDALISYGVVCCRCCLLSVLLCCTLPHGVWCWFPILLDGQHAGCIQSWIFPRRYDSCCSFLLVY